ncbi:MAG TPA: hypothetical protein VGG10_11650 [Rhizomicrobium sp.]|jgi:hypothetical protein
MPRKLVVRGPTYFAPGDEKAFFDWLQSIPCVEDVRGSLRDLHIIFKRPPSNGDLRELIALLHRYRMNMKPLAAFRTPRNAEWFTRPGSFWHAKVFGKSR